MTPQANMRRIGWFALMTICTIMYGALHFQVWSVSSEVKKAERAIVSLEQQNMLLETEFMTRSSQMQLAAWNRVDFGYTAPDADQFIASERQLSRFGSDRGESAPEPLRLASFDAAEEAPPFPTLVSPITGRPLDAALVEVAEVEDEDDSGAIPLAASIARRTVRMPMNATAAASGAAIRLSLGGAGQ